MDLNHIYWDCCQLLIIVNRQLSILVSRSTKLSLTLEVSNEFKPSFYLSFRGMMLSFEG